MNSARLNKLLTPEQVTKLDSYKRHGVHLQDAARFAEPVEATGAAATGADDASPSQEPVLQLQRLRGKLPDMSAAPSSCAEKKEMQTQPQLGGPGISAKSVKFPWCEDVASGNKFFESVANKPGKRNGAFSGLQANDLFVVLGAGAQCKVMAVGRLLGSEFNNVEDRSILYAKLLPERREALDREFGAAPSFNYVLFDKVLDLRMRDVRVDQLAVHIGIFVKTWRWQGFNFFVRDDARTCQRLEGFLQGCPIHECGQQHAINQLGDVQVNRVDITESHCPSQPLVSMPP